MANYILVVSDSHGNSQILKDLVNKYPDAYAYFHLGDSELNEMDIYPFTSVKGNNDYLITTPYLIISLFGHNFYLIHGDKMYLIKENLARRAKLNNCDYILYGHTHRPTIENYEGINIINPGALAYPRSPMGETYAIITFNEDKVDVKIKEYY